MEDMTDYFSTLDQAVQNQEMPVGFQNTVCNIYCQDCEKTGQCKYHFVGQKCPHCGSYNTREMGRFESSTTTI
jgi:RING finger/CHY zinc finger protein 1